MEEGTVLVEIFSHLTTEADLVRSSMVCKIWREVVIKNNSVWMGLAKKSEATNYLVRLWEPSRRFPTFFDLYR